MAFVSADLLVLPLALLHEFLKSSVVVLGDSLGGHLDGAVTVGRLDLRRNLLNRGLQLLDTEVLVQALAGQNIQRRSHQLDLDLALRGVVRLRGTEGFLDSVDAIVAKAGNLDIGTDLGGVGGELAADVLLELLLDGFAGERDIFPDGGVSKINLSERPVCIE